MKEVNMIKFYERIPRSIAKLITWRVVITANNFITGWLASGDPWVGLKVAAGLLVINSIIYYLHERAWNKSNWGKKIITPIEP
jgi:uncharacterized membrane protein